MTSLQSHYTALSILEKVLETSVPFNEDALIFTVDDVHINRDGEEIKSEVFFFIIGSDIYSVKLYGDGGEVKRLIVTETWTVFPTDNNEEEKEEADGEED